MKASTSLHGRRLLAVLAIIVLLLGMLPVPAAAVEEPVATAAAETPLPTLAPETEVPETEAPEPAPAETQPVVEEPEIPEEPEPPVETDPAAPSDPTVPVSPTNPTNPTNPTTPETEKVTVTAVAGAEGTVTLNGEAGPLTVDKGTEITVVVTAVTELYHIDQVLVEADAQALPEKNQKTLSFTFAAQQDTTVTANFAKDTYTLKVTVSGEGSAQNRQDGSTVTDTAEYEVEVQTTLEFLLTSKARNHLTGLQFNGVNQLDQLTDQGAYTTAPITEDSALELTFTGNHLLKPDAGQELTNAGYRAVPRWADAANTDAVPTQPVLDAGALARLLLPKDAAVDFFPTAPYTMIAKAGTEPAQGVLTVTENQAAGQELTVGKAPVVRDQQDLRVPFSVEFDQTAPEIALTAQVPAPFTVFGQDFDAQLTVKEDLTDLKSIHYDIYSADAPETILQSGDIALDDAELTLTKEGDTTTAAVPIHVKAITANGEDIVIAVTAVNAVGMEGTGSTHVAVNTEDPTLKVEFKGAAPVKDGPRVYTRESVAITITVTDPDYTLARDVAFAEGENPGVYVTLSCKNAEGESLSVELQAEATPNPNVYTLNLDDNGNYTLEKVLYRNKAGHEASDGGYQFTVDSVAPKGTVEVKESSWSGLLSALTLGAIDKNELVFTLRAEDEICPAAELALSYCVVKQDSDKLLDKTALEGRTWTATTNGGKVTVSDEEQFVVYLRVEDKAGNVDYFSSQGVNIVDHTNPAAPVITIKAGSTPRNGIYRTDVPLSITVTDPISGGTYSGLQSVVCTIESSGRSETLTLLENGEVKTGTGAVDDLGRIRNYAGSVTVGHNSNNIKVTVTAVDKAGRPNSDDLTLSIDKTAPTIRITPAQVTGYQNQPQTFTVTVTERNFDAKDFAFLFTNREGVNPAQSGWTHVHNGGNGDNDTHTITLTYRTDGVYAFATSFMDMAGNQAAQHRVGEFTLDMTAPVITVRYDNNSPKDNAESSYFDAPRTATVTVTEHNFDPSKVVFNPAYDVSWTNSGDTHTATVQFQEDGHFTFDLSATDLAGNGSPAVDYGDSAFPNDFWVDTQYDEMIRITGIEDGKAYGKDSVPTGAAITVEDPNLAPATVKATLSVQTRGSVSTKELQLSGSDTQLAYTLSADGDLAEDGLYTLNVQAADKAGNYGNHNDPAGETIRFTINRNGSFYLYDDNLQNLIDGVYHQNVDEDIVITIVNASPLDEDGINVILTRDGTPIDAQYTLECVNQDGVEWYEYRLTIKKENFEQAGLYTLSVETKDAETGNGAITNTAANSEPALDEISFYVDRQIPALTSVTGLEKDIVDAPEQVVSFEITDNLALGFVQVLVDETPVELTFNGLDDEGNLVAMTADEVTRFADEAAFQASFTLEEKSSAQHVRFLVRDKAGNELDTDKVDFTDKNALDNPDNPTTAVKDMEEHDVSVKLFEKDITVSTNFLVRWYANKPLFFGSTGGALALAAAAGALAAAKKKKKVAVG